MKYPKSIQNLIDYFSKLPTVGPKTAERYVFYLLQQGSDELQGFAQAIAELKEKIQICQECGAVSESSPCFICADKNREQNIICVVANTRDMLAVESSNQYNGMYHILGGVISPVSGIGPKKLNIESLLKKIKDKKINEIIIALNPNMEGETTAMHLTKVLKPAGVKITRIARGLPTGSDLEYADEMTIANALKYRTDL